MRTLVFLLGCLGIAEGYAIAGQPPVEDLVVLGYNDLGMHCMNKDFSNLCILPPYNTLRAQIIRRGNGPEIITSEATVTYSIPGNTFSVGKTNFWNYTNGLFGVTLPPNIGLTGNGLTGRMTAMTGGDWGVTGIPITPLTDGMALDAYQLATIQAQAGSHTGSTQAVVPVSWEISCDQCHKDPTASRFGSKDSVDRNILKAHDRLHGTNLINQRPVLCASCHADPALGTPGQPGVSNMSQAMHSAHDARMQGMNPETKCYSCHPGNQTQCLRDVHKANGMNCQSCHGDMNQVGAPNRTPWVDEPKCGSCHHVPGHEYEQPGKLFRDSVGHNGVKCIACHNSPHVIAPSTNARDNVQAISKQGFAGTIQKCTVCHITTPEDPFNHTRHD